MRELFNEMTQERKERHRQWKEENLTKLGATRGLLFRVVNDGECCLFRESGKPRVDFYPSTGRWRIPGSNRPPFKGGATAFIHWYEKQGGK